MIPDRAALTQEEFSRGAREDLVRATSAGADFVISRLGWTEDRKLPKPPSDARLRPLNDEVHTVVAVQPGWPWVYSVFW